MMNFNFEDESNVSSHTLNAAASPWMSQEFVSQPNSLESELPNLSNSPIDERQRALQLALELSLMRINENVGDNILLDSSTIHAFKSGSKGQNMTECVPVPSSEHVAEIVGRQGCKIKALRAKTNTYIKTPVRGEGPVFIVTGREEDVSLAKQEILSAAVHFSQIRACRRNNLNYASSPVPPAKFPGQGTIHVRVPYKVVGLVVGPKGATIKKIQQDTQTYIVTPSRDKEPVFEVTGAMENVEQAKLQIEAHITMRTGVLIDPKGPDMIALNNEGHSPFPPAYSSLDLFSSPEMAEIYKFNNREVNRLKEISLNNAINGFENHGLNGIQNGSSNGMRDLSLNNTFNGFGSNGMSGSRCGVQNGGLNGLGNSLSSFNGLGIGNEVNFFTDENDRSSLGNLLNKPSFDASIFSSLNHVGSSNEMTGSGYHQQRNLYSNIDEGLGSLGSSMRSSPSFDQISDHTDHSSSIWSDTPKYGSSSGFGSMSANPILSSPSSSPTMEFPGMGQTPPSIRRTSCDSSNTIASSLLSSISSNPDANLPELRIPPTPIGFGRAIAANSPSRSGSPSSSLIDKRCHTCLGTDVVAVLIPCGHNLLCMDCANQLMTEEKECPSCQTYVTQIIKILN